MPGMGLTIGAMEDPPVPPLTSDAVTVTRPVEATEARRPARGRAAVPGQIGGRGGPGTSFRGSARVPLRGVAVVRYRGIAAVTEATTLINGELRRELTRLDAVLFLISAMVVVDTIGAIAAGGPQVFTWLVILFLTFFVPSGLACAELGAAIPEEGGAYVWVRTAFGRFTGALTSLFYWASTPLWLGGSVTIIAISVVRGFLVSLPVPGMVAFGLAFIGLATAAAVVPLRYGKWIPNSGAYAQILLLSFFTLSVVLYGFRHGVHGLAPGGFLPTRAVFIGVVPVLLFSFVGVELPSAAGGEMRNPRRDIPTAIGRAGVALMIMYCVPVLAVLLVLPAEQITSLHGLIDTMKAVFTVYGGSVGPDGTTTLSGAGLVLGWAGAVVFLWVLLASGTAWIMGASRTQAAACLDGAGPKVLGRVSPRTGVPVVMAVLTGVISIAAMLANVTITGGDAQRYFSAALTASIVLIVLAYLLIYPSFLVLRLRQPGLDRPFRVPGGLPVAWLVAGLGTVWSLLVSASLLWPGVGTAHPDALLPAGFAGERWQFEVLVLGPVLLVVLAVAGYFAVARVAGGSSR